MKHTASNIVLIGMPGSGKSTVGVILARLTSRAFIDTDILIQTAAGKPLQQIIDSEGYLALRSLEEEVLLGITCRGHVIATGGSAAYSRRAMEHLRSDGVVVFLDADIATLEGRVRDFTRRGLAKRADQTFADLFAERLPLYREYANITVCCAGLSHEEVCSRIVDQLVQQDDVGFKEE
jgi:shikimate kinase